MGNCLFGGVGEDNGVVKVITSNGGIMEFYAPVTVDSITDEFPGHGLFRSHDLFWKPISDHEVLLAGQSYYLLPLNSTGKVGQIAQVGHVRSNSAPTSSVGAPYTMSFGSQRMVKKRPSSSYHSCGCRVWKVKLVISPEQLMEILSEEGPTQELIESVRTVAKCGNGVAFSDRWSLSSSKKDGLLEI